MFKGSLWWYKMITKWLSEPNQNQYTFTVPQNGEISLPQQQKDSSNNNNGEN